MLRTPLTGLRLELEELSERPDLNDDVRRSAARSPADAERLETTVSQLLGVRPRAQPRWPGRRSAC
ncbi:histidine kinase dimerization/phospho-acceptor domain-containing protein [Nocardioides sp. B-3]|uniref:histidine kinase dimerization/phospho-acceptor domain-containing protein n=1 Tax=Nocardioides sp. B-3 TaxID=2895565 RepID=UPI003FA57194